MDHARAARIARELAGQQVGDWKIEHLINNGGSAAVFFGRNATGQEAAVKLFDPELIERYGERVQRERLQRELELVGQYHPNLVEILDGGTCDRSGYDYVAMRYYPWRTLKECVSDFPRDRISTAIGQLASAARYLHEKGLAHRDIKPSNIVVSPDFDRVVLLDLGVVRPIAASDITDSSEFIGTRRYSPPEFVFRRESDDQRGWVAVTFYQLGAVLHDLIMRRPLFDGIDNIAALIDAIRTEAPRVDATDLPAELVQLSRACLTKATDLRLRFVDWTAFENAAGYRLDDLTWPDEHGTALEPPDLETITNIIRERARAQCIGNDDFSPLKITSRCEHDYAAVQLRFAPSKRHRLANALWIFLRIAPVDAALRVVRLSATIVVSPPDANVEEISKPFTESETNVDGDAIGGYIQRLLGQAFDFAHTFASRVNAVTPLLLLDDKPL
jgi:serine/threonine protein kinase